MLGLRQGMLEFSVSHVKEGFVETAFQVLRSWRKGCRL